MKMPQNNLNLGITQILRNCSHVPDTPTHHILG